MGEPADVAAFVRLEAGDLVVYVSKEIWEGLVPGQSKLLVAVSGFGRFWLQVRE
jgi:hypothetical protein